MGFTDMVAELPSMLKCLFRILSGAIATEAATFEDGKLARFRPIVPMVLVPARHDEVGIVCFGKM